MNGSIILTVGAAAVVAVAANEVMRVYLRTIRKDRARLHAATEALNDHIAAVEKLVASESVAPSLKKFAVTMASGSINHGCARRLVSVLRGSSPVPEAHAERTAEVVHALDLLKARHPDDYETFGRVLKSGVVALVLQWPDTSRAIEDLAVRMAKDSPETTVQRFSSLQGAFRPSGHAMA